MDINIYNAVKSGRMDNSIKFKDFRKLILDLGFIFVGQVGSHQTYRHPGIRVKISIQPDGNMAKGYQVKQLRNIIIKYNL